MNLNDDDLMAGYAAYATVDELATVPDDETAPASTLSTVTVFSVIATVHFTC